MKEHYLFGEVNGNYRTFIKTTSDSDGKLDGFMGVCTLDGKEVLAPQFVHVIIRFDKYAVAFLNDDTITPEYYNLETGRLLTDELKASEVCNIVSTDIFLIQRDGKKYFVDKIGNEIFETKDNYLYDMHTGTVIVSDGKHKGLVACEGREILPCKFDEINTHFAIPHVRNSGEDNYMQPALDFLPVKIDFGQFYVGLNKAPLFVDCRYLTPFTKEGYAIVGTEGENREHVIDRKGNIVSDGDFYKLSWLGDGNLIFEESAITSSQGIMDIHGKVLFKTMGTIQPEGNGIFMYGGYGDYESFLPKTPWACFRIKDGRIFQLTPFCYYRPPIVEDYIYVYNEAGGYDAYDKETGELVMKNACDYVHMPDSSADYEQESCVTL